VDQLDAAGPHLVERLEQLPEVTRVVVTVALDLLLVPRRLGEPRVGKDAANSACEASGLGFDEVAHALLDAPLALGAVPRGHVGGDGAELRAQALCGGTEEAGDLLRGERPGPVAGDAGCVRGGFDQAFAGCC